MSHSFKKLWLRLSQLQVLILGVLLCTDCNSQESNLGPQYYKLDAVSTRLCTHCSDRMADSTRFTACGETSYYKNYNYIRSNAECIGNINPHMFWGCSNPPPIPAQKFHSFDLQIIFIVLNFLF